MVLLVDHLVSKGEALSLNPSMAKKKQKQKQKNYSLRVAS
jgi:hypothetical protein